MLSATPASPQGGLFGATRPDVAGNRLNFTFEVGEGVASELPPALRSRLPQEIQADGWSTLFAASSDYAHMGKRVEFGATASSAIKYYQQLNRLDTLSHAAGLGIQFHLPLQGNLRINSTAAYSPSYLYQLFPVGESPGLGISTPANPDYQIDDIQSYAYRTAMALAFGSARGTLVTVAGQFDRTEFEHQTVTRPDFESYGTGARVSRALSRSGGFSVSYDYRASEFAFGGLTTEHRVAIGADYSPALSRTRRATFRFSLGSAILDVPESPLTPISADPEAGRSHRHLNGEASIGVPFWPNWRAAVSYRREVAYLAVLREPVLSEGARAELTGLIARRVDLSALAAYATVASVLGPARPKAETYTGEVRIRYALKRSLALYSEYLYYYYDLRGQAALTPDLPREFEQHGVRVGVMLFLEALR